MQETDIWCRFGNNLAIEFEHESQHAMRSRVRRAHIENHFFADIVIGVVQFRCHHSRHRVSRFNLTRCERHEKTYKVKRLQSSKRITFTLASGPAHASNFGWVAHAFRVCLAAVSRRRKLFRRSRFWGQAKHYEKSVSARRRNQHAGRVRYPAKRTRACDGT